MQRPMNQEPDVLGQEEADVPAQAESKLARPPPVCSDLHELDDADAHWH